MKYLIFLIVLNWIESVIAYAVNFPDGLCGGPLAYVKRAPLLLMSAGKETASVNYISDKNIPTGIALGGSGVLPYDTVKLVFSMDKKDVFAGERYE